MNILFLNSLGKAKWGGGEKWMIAAGKGLMNRGHRVIIACLSGSIIEQKAVNNELEIFHFSIPADIAFWKMYPLKSFLKQNNIDVVICCQNKDVKIGAKAARQINIPAIISRQGLQNLSDKKKYVKPFTQYIDGIITNTISLKNVYESYKWFPENFIHVIYNGVNIPKKINSINLREKYNLPSCDKIIFSSGRLAHQKGFDLLIDVALKAKTDALSWQILVAGTGKLKNELKALAVKNCVEDVIHFIGFSNDIPGLLTASDLFVLPSRREGMSNSLLEAMALGKASVVTEVNGASELIENGVTGILVESENTNQLYEKIKFLIDNEVLKTTIGEHAKNKVLKNFTNEKMIDNMEKLFHHIIDMNSQKNNK